MGIGISPHAYVDLYLALEATTRTFLLQNRAQQLSRPSDLIFEARNALWVVLAHCTHSSSQYPQMYRR